MRTAGVLSCAHEAHSPVSDASPILMVESSGHVFGLSACISSPFVLIASPERPKTRLEISRPRCLMGGLRLDGTTTPGRRSAPSYHPLVCGQSAPPAAQAAADEPVTPGMGAFNGRAGCVNAAIWSWSPRRMLSTSQIRASPSDRVDASPPPLFRSRRHTAVRASIMGSAMIGSRATCGSTGMGLPRSRSGRLRPLSPRRRRPMRMPCPRNRRVIRLDR